MLEHSSGTDARHRQTNGPGCGDPRAIERSASSGERMAAAMLMVVVGVVLGHPTDGSGSTDPEDHRKLSTVASNRHRPSCLKAAQRATTTLCTVSASPWRTRIV